MSLLVAFRNTAARSHSQIKKARLTTKQDFSGEALSKQNKKAWLAVLSCDLSKALTEWSTIFAFGLWCFFLSYLVKNSMDCVSVICKLAMKWYLMRMCSSWLCPFSRRPSLGVCNYSNCSFPGLFADPSIFSLNLPQTQPPQKPQWPITSTDFIISPED